MASFLPGLSSLLSLSPLWLHLPPGCPTLQSSNFSGTASTPGLWSHPSFALHQPILRCPISRCLTWLLWVLQFPVLLVTSLSHGTPICWWPSSNLDCYKSSLWREVQRARMKAGQMQIKAEEQNWRPSRDNIKTQSLQMQKLPWSQLCRVMDILLLSPGGEFSSQFPK